MERLSWVKGSLLQEFSDGQNSVKTPLGNIKWIIIERNPTGPEEAHWQSLFGRHLALEALPSHSKIYNKIIKDGGAVHGKL